jgi:hypothetical protein
MSYRVCGSGMDELFSDEKTAVDTATIVTNNRAQLVANIFLECDNCGCTAPRSAKNWTKNPLSAFCPKCTNVYWED